MGSDLSMEAQSWRPRADKVFWEWRPEDAEHVLIIEKDRFYQGYSRVFEGKINLHDPTQMALLEALIGKKQLPKKPVPPKIMRNEIDQAIRVFFGHSESGLLLQILNILKLYGVDIDQQRNPE